MTAKVDPLRPNSGGENIFPKEHMSARCRAFYNDSKVLSDEEAIEIAARIMSERMKPPAQWRLSNQPANLDWMLRNTGKNRLNEPKILGFDHKRNFTHKDTGNRIAIGQPYNLTNSDFVELAGLVNLGCDVRVHGYSAWYPGRTVMLEIRSDHVEYYESDH